MVANPGDRDSHVVTTIMHRSRLAYNTPLHCVNFRPRLIFDMAILLGIDTGGTYTDAVLFDDGADSSKRGVTRSAKALTTKYDLSVGIRNAIDAVLPSSAPDIRLVSLSTTLAT